MLQGPQQQSQQKEDCGDQGQQEEQMPRSDPASDPPRGDGRAKNAVLAKDSVYHSCTAVAHSATPQPHNGCQPEDLRNRGTDNSAGPQFYSGACSQPASAGHSFAAVCHLSSSSTPSKQQARRNRQLKTDRSDLAGKAAGKAAGCCAHTHTNRQGHRVRKKAQRADVQWQSVDVSAVTHSQSSGV